MSSVIAENQGERPSAIPEIRRIAMIWTRLGKEEIKRGGDNRGSNYHGIGLNQGLGPHQPRSTWQF